MKQGLHNGPTKCHVGGGAISCEYAVMKGLHTWLRVGLTGIWDLRRCLVRVVWSAIIYNDSAIMIKQFGAFLSRECSHSLSVCLVQLTLQQALNPQPEAKPCHHKPSLKALAAAQCSSGTVPSLQRAASKLGLGFAVYGLGFGAS